MHEDFSTTERISNICAEYNQSHSCADRNTAYTAMCVCMCCTKVNRNAYFTRRQRECRTAEATQTFEFWRIGKKVKKNLHANYDLWTDSEVTGNPLRVT